MPTPVICVSHADGAGGAEVARLVAARLGYPYADDEIVARAARDAGLYPEALALAESREAGRKVEVDFGRFENTDKLRDLICAAIVTTADDGPVVIGAHAASFALIGRPDVLRVLVTASDGTRERRIAESESLDPRAAAKVLRESDKGRASYIKQFYDVDRELPTHYDLVVNTDVLDAAAAVEAIVTAADAAPPAPA
jgi:cytidylate kinase